MAAEGGPASGDVPTKADIHRAQRRLAVVAQRMLPKESRASIRGKEDDDVIQRGGYVAGHSLLGCMVRSPLQLTKYQNFRDIIRV